MYGLLIVALATGGLGLCLIFFLGDFSGFDAESEAEKVLRLVEGF